MKIISTRHSDKQIPKKPDDPRHIDFELPDGLYVILMARCRSCGKRYEHDGDIEDFDEDYSYCGGSPRCIP